MSDAILIQELTKTYRTLKKGHVVALSSVSFCVKRGEVFGFLGPNGAGKSTTIKCLMGLIRPSAGNVRLMGEDASSHHARHRVGYLPENPALYDHVSGEQYLTMVGRIKRMSSLNRKDQIERLLRRLSLYDARKRLIRSYSKGMVQRLGLAQALLGEPALLVLDEPMSGLDPMGRALVKEILLELKAKGHTLFFSTHITSDVEMLCDRVAILAEGKIKGVFDVGSLMREGLKGYRIHFSSSENEVEQKVVATASLQDELFKLNRRGDDLVLVEPVRKDLQQTFLDIVNSKSTY